MFCLHCGHSDTKVINSRPHKKRATIWRRRKCPACNTVFTTSETVAGEGLLWILHGKEKQSFSLPRLLVSLYPLLSRRATAADDAQELAHTIYEKLLMQPDMTLDVSDLTGTAYDILERFDRNAALKYALEHGLISLPSRQRNKRP